MLRCLRVSKCGCSCELRAGMLLLGLLGLLTGVVGAIWGSVTAHGLDAFLAIVLGVSSLGLLYGVLRLFPLLIEQFLFFWIILGVTCLIRYSFLYFEGFKEHEINKKVVTHYFGVIMVSAGFCIYVWACVYSFYKNMFSTGYSTIN